MFGEGLLPCRLGDHADPVDRDDQVVTIDPDDAKDFDDALRIANDSKAARGYALLDRKAPAAVKATERVLRVNRLTPS